jgi:acetyl esterase/lipase
MTPRIICFLLAIAASVGFAQPARDTSFTVHSAALSIARQFPNARLVEPSMPKNVEAMLDVPYAWYGQRTLRLDLFRPTDARGGRPAIIMIHGGGWRSGDKSMQVPMAQRLASRGFVCATIEYRLSGEALYPAALYDVKAAIRWMRANGEKYGVDTNAIAVLGCSAGGTLAALAGTTLGMKRFEGNGGTPNVSSKIQAVIDIDGVRDLTDPAESGKDTAGAKPSAAAQWLGGTFAEKKAAWVDASPIVHACPRAAAFLFINSSIPRFHAGRDSVIAILTKYNIPTEVRTIPDTPHPFWLFHPWFEPTCDAVAEFLTRTFAGPRR